MEEAVRLLVALAAAIVGGFVRARTVPTVRRHLRWNLAGSCLLAACLASIWAVVSAPLMIGLAAGAAFLALALLFLALVPR